MMSAMTSATTGQRYGLERVCRTWERSRSALYARRARAYCPRTRSTPSDGLILRWTLAGSRRS